MQFRLSNNHCFWWNYYSVSIVNRDKIWTRHKDLVQRGYSIKTMILNHYVFHSESWSSSILVIWCKQITRKSPWCWEMLRAEGEEGVRGYDDWMMSPTQWTWIWANAGKWWGTGRPGVLQSMGSPTGSDTTGDWPIATTVVSILHINPHMTLLQLRTHVQVKINILTFKSTKLPQDQSFTQEAMEILLKTLFSMSVNTDKFSFSIRRWWRTGKPGILQSMGSQRVGQNWATEQQQ